MNMPCLRQAIEYVFTYFGWGYLYFSAGYFLVRRIQYDRCRHEETSICSLEAGFSRIRKARGTGEK